MKTSQAPEVRSKGAIAQVLIKLLYVPTIYFDAAWPSARNRSDILAIDRAGSGDVHVVAIAKDIDEAEKALPKLMQIPAQFRWISFPKEQKPDRMREYKRVNKLPLFPEDGMGRVGVILVAPDEDCDSEGLAAVVAKRAERFPGSYYDEADKFMAKHKADILFR
ncbi:MAG TPA: hypothetical protein VFC46_13130 [Humisphaera sp.]|nr:hypothetical protein [Humisphaera sp.]